MYNDTPRRLFCSVRYRKRRAVSDIVGSLLMLAVVASLGVLVFTFASGGLGALSQSFTNLMTGSADAVSEHEVVEQVVFFFSGTTGADVYVRNVGTISSTLVSVYIVDQSSNTFVSQFTISTCTINGAVVTCTIPVGNFGLISHSTGVNPLTFTPAHGHTYSFTVTSSLGNSVIYYAKAT